MHERDATKKDGHDPASVPVPSRSKWLLRLILLGPIVVLIVGTLVEIWRRSHGAPP